MSAQEVATLPSVPSAEKPPSEPAAPEVEIAPEAAAPEVEVVPEAAPEPAAAPEAAPEPAAPAPEAAPEPAPEQARAPSGEAVAEPAAPAPAEEAPPKAPSATGSAEVAKQPSTHGEGAQETPREGSITSARSGIQKAGSGTRPPSGEKAPGEPIPTHKADSENLVSFSKTKGLDHGDTPKTPSKSQDLMDFKRGSKHREGSTTLRDGSLRWSSKSLGGMRSKIALGSIISIRRGSYASYAERQKVMRFANTFKLESDKPFNFDKVQKIITTVVNEEIEELTYDSENCGVKAKQICINIKDQIKAENYDRYKIIVLVTIGEKKSQDMYSVFRFLWDAERDHYAHYFNENMQVFLAAVVFGIYFE